MKLTAPDIVLDSESDETEKADNPYLLTGPELSRTAARRMQGYNP